MTNAKYHGPLERPAGARLVWRDEFTGSRLDLAKWRYDTAHNKRGWFNGELQYSSAGRPQNIRLKNGGLVIAARRETLKSAPDWGGQNYTSGRIVPKQAWTYGFYLGVDGSGILRVLDDQPGGKGAWPFDTPFHLILNLAMGGNWAAAKGMDDAALPQRMEADYVRVWQNR